MPLPVSEGVMPRLWSQLEGMGIPEASGREGWGTVGRDWRLPTPARAMSTPRFEFPSDSTLSSFRSVGSERVRTRMMPPASVSV